MESLQEGITDQAVQDEHEVFEEIPATDIQPGYVLKLWGEVERVIQVKNRVNIFFKEGHEWSVVSSVNVSGIRKNV